MPRVKQPMLHVSSSISCDLCYISVCPVCAMIRVRVCRCVQVCALEPQISAFRFFYSVCCCCLQLRTLLLWMCGPLPCILGHVCVYVLCVCSVYVQLRYNSNRTARLCGPLLCVCCHCIYFELYAYVRCVCAMTRKHLECATTVPLDAVTVRV